MAKIQTLTERGTDETIYPLTAAEAVHFTDGETAEAKAAATKAAIEKQGGILDASLSDAEASSGPGGVTLRVHPNKGEAVDKPFPMASTEKAGAVSAAQVKAWDAARAGAFIDLARSYGAGYDEATGLFSLNGLTDISIEQMRVIVAAGRLTNSDTNCRYVGSAIRTHLPGQIRWGVTKCIRTFTNSAVEVVRDNYIQPGIMCFNGCAKLRTIQVWSQGDNGGDAFRGCVALENLTFYGATVARSFSLADSPLISLASLKGIIDKATTGAAATTITVHPTVYAKITGEAEAEEGWTDLPTLAAPKNITFTTTT